MTTLLWDAQEALRTLLAAAVQVPVYDAGDLVGEDDRAFVVVGDPSDEGDTATAEQVTSNMGNLWRDETGSLPCRLEVWTGDTAIAPLRATARALLTACTDAVHADRSLGGLLVLPGFAEVTAVSLREGQTERGALVSAGFTVSYSALLTT